MQRDGNFPLRQLCWGLNIALPTGAGAGAALAGLCSLAQEETAHFGCRCCLCQRRPQAVNLFTAAAAAAAAAGTVGPSGTRIRNGA